MQIRYFPSFLGCPFDLYARICVMAGLFKKQQQKGDTIYIPILSEWNSITSLLYPLL